MIDVDVFPSDTSWLSEPTTGVYQFGGGSEELSVNAMNLLRLTLGQLRATPVDASKITLPEDENGEDDPADKYF
jgi:hypothetical protein